MSPKTKKILVVAGVVTLGLSSLTRAADFVLRVLPEAGNPTFDLSTVAKKVSYYQFVHSTLGPKIQALAPSARPSSTDQAELEAGHGVSVKLSKDNYNIHVNFPNAAEHGRSYGWTAGQVGDWTDKMYLDHLAAVVTEKDNRDLESFYELVIQMLGACNADSASLSIEKLQEATQRVAANFLAIYTAEEYRAMVPQPHVNWDDAIMEVTMLGAFHGGQSQLWKFYLGKFSSTAKEQGPGVYAKFKPGPKGESAKDKPAEMNDYWQNSANPNSGQSGINETRGDFEKMGVAITKYESTVAKNQSLGKIQAIVGGDKTNVIKSIAQFFTTGQSKDVAKIDDLAKDVADFLMSVHQDAGKITTWERAGEK